MINTHPGPASFPTPAMWIALTGAAGIVALLMPRGVPHINKEESKDSR